MSAKSYLITIDGNAEIQSAKERLFNLAPDFVHSIEKDDARIAALEAQNKKLVEALSQMTYEFKHDDHNLAYPDCNCESHRNYHNALALLSEVTQ